MTLPKSVEDFKKLANDRQRMVNSMRGMSGDEFLRVANKVFDTDVAIALLLEESCLDAVIEVTTKTQVDSSGDFASGTTVEFSGKGQERIQVNAEDLWFVRIMKPALNPSNIRIVEDSNEKTD